MLKKTKTPLIYGKIRTEATKIKHYLLYYRFLMKYFIFSFDYIVNKERNKIIIVNPNIKHNIKYHLKFNINQLTKMPKGMGDNQS